MIKGQGAVRPTNYETQVGGCAGLLVALGMAMMVLVFMACLVLAGALR